MTIMYLFNTLIYIKYLCIHVTNSKNFPNNRSSCLHLISIFQFYFFRLCSLHVLHPKRFLSFFSSLFRKSARAVAHNSHTNSFSCYVQKFPTNLHLRGVPLKIVLSMCVFLFFFPFSFLERFNVCFVTFVR